MTDRIARAEDVIVDLGTGDGRAARAIAAANPAAVVIGVDAAAAAMAETSRRAAATHENLLFVAASVEAFADALPAVADRVTISFPWGSLLRGVLGLDDVAGAAIAAIPRPGGLVTALVSVTARDAMHGLPVLDAPAVAGLGPPRGLVLVETCPASPDEIRATRSTWGRRLLADRSGARPVWRLTWRRPVTRG